MRYSIRKAAAVLCAAENSFSVTEERALLRSTTTTNPAKFVASFAPRVTPDLVPSTIRKFTSGSPSPIFGGVDDPARRGRRRAEGMVAGDSSTGMARHHLL